MSLDHERDLLRALADEEEMPEALGIKLHTLIDQFVDAAEDEAEEARREAYDQGYKDAPTEEDIRQDILWDIDALWQEVTPLPLRNCDWRREASEPWMSLAEMTS